MPAACPRSLLYVYSEPSNLGLSRVEKPTPTQYPAGNKLEKLFSPGRGYFPMMWPQRKTDTEKLPQRARDKGVPPEPESRAELPTRLSQELPPLPGQGAHNEAWQELTRAVDHEGSLHPRFPFPNGGFYLHRPCPTPPQCTVRRQSADNLYFNPRVPGLYGEGKSRVTVVNM